MVFYDENSMPASINGWECTDPDGYQYQRKVEKRSFDMVQAFEMPDDSFRVCRSNIDIDEYSSAEIEDYVTGYYASVDELKASYEEGCADGIIAECIFESLQPIDYDTSFVANTEEEARNLIIGELTKEAKLVMSEEFNAKG